MRKPISPQAQNNVDPTDVKINYRPRPIDIYAELPIITDPNLQKEIEIENAKYEALQQRKKKRKIVDSDEEKPPEGVVPIPDFKVLEPTTTKKQSVKKKGFVETEDAQDLALNIPGFQRPKKERIKYQGRTYNTHGKLTRASEKSADELYKMTEYDMDTEDEDFVKAINDRPSKAKKYSTLTEDLFETIFDFFEKESFNTKFSFKMEDDSLFGYTKWYPGFEEDVPCCICNDGDYEENNQIVFCDGCDIAVHQVCYGIKEVPKGPWRCSKCQSGEKNITCVFCPELEGAFKRTNDNRWAHVVCALWIPGVSFGSPDTMEPIERIDKINKSLWNQECSLCNQSMGVCVQCSDSRCKKTFHVMCARARALLVELKRDNDNSVQFLQCCRTHSMQRLVQQDTNKLFGFWELTDEQLEKLVTLVNESGRGIEIDPETLEVIYQYWRLKRRRHPSPLIRRFQVLGKPRRVADGTLSTEEYYARFVKLRQDFEKVRLLIDLVRKREVCKRDYLKACCELEARQINEINAEIRKEQEEAQQRELERIRKERELARLEKEKQAKLLQQEELLSVTKHKKRVTKTKRQREEEEGDAVDDYEEPVVKKKQKPPHSPPKSNNLKSPKSSKYSQLVPIAVSPLDRLRKRSLPNGARKN